MKDVAGAIKAFFSFLIYERDPDKQARRAANHEYKLLKRAVWHAHKSFYWEDEMNVLPITGDKRIRAKKKLFRSKHQSEKRKFRDLMARD